MAIELRFRVFKDPVSASTHFAGFLIGIIGVGALLFAAARDPGKLVGMAIYGGALLTLFLASSLYHFLDVSERVNHWLRRCDHAAIFLFIAACFVPPVLHLMDGTWRVVLLSVAGTLGVAGAAYKLIWFRAPLWVDMTGYLGMGWLGVTLLPRMFSAQPSYAIWMMAGGLSYTVGAVVYALERPNPWPRVFGHHEIWHLFVLGGAASHYVLMFSLLDWPRPPFAG